MYDRNNRSRPYSQGDCLSISSEGQETGTGVSAARPMWKAKIPNTHLVLRIQCEIGPPDSHFVCRRLLNQCSWGKRRRVEDCSTFLECLGARTRSVMKGCVSHVSYAFVELESQIYMRWSFLHITRTRKELARGIPRKQVACSLTMHASDTGKLLSVADSSLLPVIIS